MKPGEIRRNRVVVMLTDAEHSKLAALASKLDVPLGTAAHDLVARALRRR
jgi:hypothetical protein